MLLRSLACGLSLVLCAPAGIAKENPLFESHEILKAVLTAPIAQVYAQKDQEVRLYFPGKWAYVDTDGETKYLQVSIRTRGHFRRGYCALPPLRLNFSKKEVGGTLFEGQDKLKLVAPCRRGNLYQQLVIREYLAYRTYEILSENSFKTRLLRLSYVDSDEKRDPFTAYVFVIEDDSDLAKRLGLKRFKIPKVAYGQLDQSSMALVQLFHFLIGNGDYSLIDIGIGDECCHNTQILRDKNANDILIPVPFDFDASGLVDAPYAVPPAMVPVRDVYWRYYRGLCQPREYVDEAIALMKSKRSEIVTLYTELPVLDERSRKKALRYIEEFYEILDDPELAEKTIYERCRRQDLLDQMLETQRLLEIPTGPT